ncbi:MAG TPA: RimK family protein [Caldimonas sp.]|jgi:glutathione synthase/RimK-type ligase-like ATP-grasp enzyme|nr:RimK family protein [Caldimonas sp.]HEX2542884.1 RimK family protein [Caldimonas sp.]
MRAVFVTDRSQDWPFELPGSTVVTARNYLADAATGAAGDAQVINLCRSDRYQGRGYYVSLLAEARGHRPLPDVKTIEDLKSEERVQAVGAELDALVDETLHHDASERFELDAYFGRDPAERHPVLAEQLFAHVRAPLLRTRFRRADGRWTLEKIAAVGVADVPVQHRPFLLEAAKAFVTEREPSRRPRTGGSAADRPKVAILRDPAEKHKPSNDEAIQRFVDAAPAVGLQAEVIGPDALERLPEFDGLLIRCGTDVAGFSYEFARRAEALAMPVVDDPDSILKCTNKVFLSELMQRHRIPEAKTMIVHRENLHEVVPTLGLPCVLKLPDSGFGLDVLKIEAEDQLASQAERFFRISELLIAQQWLPTGFDWRVGVYDRRPLFVCKYFMAPGHWKVNRIEPGQEVVEGETVAVSVGEAPEIVVDTAVRAANLIGRGLYGVDLKQVDDRCYLIEVNDNPNIDAGNEDQVLGPALYREVMGVYARRIAERRGTASG